MTVAGSGIQGSVTLAIGVIGLLTFPVLPKIAAFTSIDLDFFLPIAVLLLSVIIYFWFRQPLKRHIREVVTHLKNIKNQKLFIASIWALLRYAVFSSQFALALFAFGFSSSIPICFAGIFLLYFCQSYIPFTAFGELGVREILAILIFGSFLPNPMLAVFATLIVWIANIGLPVLVGALSLRFSKRPIFGNS